MRRGILSFEDKTNGMPLVRPEHVFIGDFVVAYDDWGTWRIEQWTSEAFMKKFIRVEQKMSKQENAK